MTVAEEPTVRRADGSDMESVGQMLHDFNVEFDDPTPAPGVLADRMRELVDSDDTVVLLAGKGPDGLSVLRFRRAIWSEGLECYLAEFYVKPSQRGRGIGRVLLDSSLHEARQRGADTIDLGTDETDTVARHLYESHGFTNRANGKGAQLSTSTNGNSDLYGPSIRCPD